MIKIKKDKELEKKCQLLLNKLQESSYSVLSRLSFVYKGDKKIEIKKLKMDRVD